VQKTMDTNGDNTADVDGSSANALLSGWNFSVGSQTKTTSDSGYLEYNVANGTYGVTESNAQAHRYFETASCSKGGVAVGTFNATTKTVSGLAMNTDETISCTFRNGVDLYCGDGIKNNSEQCDGTDGVGTHQTCDQSCHLQAVPYCGDGIKNNSEQCDGTDGVGTHQTCTAQCALENVPYCGDGIKNNSEQCDGTDGVGTHQTCTAQCALENVPYCGDGIKNNSEQCDGSDGVGTHQTCDQSCHLQAVPYCGDGIKNNSEQCDGTDGVGTHQTCDQSCHLQAVPYCGDGIKNNGEQCDGSDGVGTHQTCDQSCHLQAVPYCGDGIKNNSEQCDGTDGVSAGYTCSDECTLIRDTGTLTGLKFNDLNGNASLDAGEPGVAGVTISLSNGSTTSTDAGGHYTFSDVPQVHTTFQKRFLRVGQTPRQTRLPA